MDKEKGEEKHDCLYCKGRGSVEWSPVYFAWTCWKCGMVDRKREARERKTKFCVLDN